jgi:hypothetical protein
VKKLDTMTLFESPVLPLPDDLKQLLVEDSGVTKAG